jgi:hypothetical protein
MARSVRLDVFGKQMMVDRFEGGWRTYLMGSVGKRSFLNIAIPHR